MNFSTSACVSSLRFSCRKYSLWKGDYTVRLHLEWPVAEKIERFQWKERACIQFLETSQRIDFEFVERDSFSAAAWIDSHIYSVSLLIELKFCICELQQHVYSLCSTFPKHQSLQKSSAFSSSRRLSSQARALSAKENKKCQISESCKFFGIRQNCKMETKLDMSEKIQPLEGQQRNEYDILSEPRV